MARKPKPGLDYFNLDIGFYDDHKILLAEEYIDPDGTQPLFRLLCAYVYIRLLENIYKNGYYLQWDDYMALTFSNKIGRGLTFELIKKYINSFLESGLFIKEIYNSNSILTSKSIMERYIYVIRSSNKKIDISELSTFVNGLSPTDKPFGGTELAKTGQNLHFGTQIIFPFTNNKYNTDNTIVVVKEELSTPESPNGTPESPNGTPESPNGTPESQIPTSKEIAEYEKNLLIPRPIEHCLWMFLNNQKLQRTKELFVANHKELLQQSFDDTMGLVEKWGRAFNRHLISQAITELPMQGGAGNTIWPKYFSNWVGTQDKKKNPDTLEKDKMSLGKNKNGFENTVQQPLKKFDEVKNNERYK